MQNEQTFPLSTRRTKKYAIGWSHLDDWEEIGTATIERAKKSHFHGESFNQLQIIKVDAPDSNQETIMESIYDTMQRSCRCEHDCCGCFSSYVQKIRPLCDSRFAVLIAGNQNV